MGLPTLLDKAPAWTADEKSAPTPVVWSECTLVRNLGDFPFPDVCSLDDKQAVRDRVVAVLDRLNILSHGHYFNWEDLSDVEQRFLAERQLVTRDLLFSEGARGVYFSEDQNFSIMINGSDHLCLRAIQPGLQLQEAWAQVNLLDDMLGGVLDYAFLESHGYLTPSMEMLGTGLKANVLLHLPGLSFTGGVRRHLAAAEERRLLLLGVLAEDKAGQAAGRASFAYHSIFSAPGNVHGGAPDKTYGELYQALNQSTLGLSEAEILFQVRLMAEELMAEELAVRAELQAEPLPNIEDRVGRALGIAQNAHLMEFFEGMEILSALRWGVQSGMLAGVRHSAINLAALAIQAAHLEMGGGGAVSDTDLNARRAAYMRAHFAQQ